MSRNTPTGILIAEDDKTSRSLLEAVLTGWGYEVVVACNGKEAWGLATAPDSSSLLILDWMMPEIDGVELCRRIRQIDGNVPKYIILLTVRSNKEDVVLGLEAGANDYVVKPFDDGELHARIKVGEQVVKLQSILANRVKKLELEVEHRKQVEEKLQRLTHNLGERVKELNCLYGISHLVEEHGASPEEIFQGIVDLIPSSWQYPEITCGRIILNGQEFKTDNFGETIWKQATHITLRGDPIGTLEVCYLEERVEIDEGPFLKEERNLINAVARQLGHISERILVAEELWAAHQQLETTNQQLQEAIERANRMAVEAELTSIELNQIFQTAADGMRFIDKDFHVLRVNETFCAMSGTAEEQVVGRKCYEGFPGSMCHTRQCPLSRIIDGEERVECEVEEVRPDGTRIPCIVTATPFRGLDGEVIGIVEDFKDISARKQAEEALQKAHDGLESRVKERTAELAIVNKQLEREIRERRQAEQEVQRNYNAQAVINSLLRLSLEDISLDEILHRALELILSLPWLAIESQGGIFLAEDEPQVLVMKAERGLHQEIKNTCARLPFGKCLCGRAALTGNIEFESCLTGRHEIRYDGIVPHGHYCVPIVLADKTVGVMNLYLREGHCRSEREEEFLTAVANTLANIVVRKRTEEQIHRSKAMLQGVFDGISEPLVMLDRNLSVRVLNRSAWEYYKVSKPQDVVGKYCYQGFMGRSGPCEGCEIPLPVSTGKAATLERKGLMDRDRFEQVIIYPIHERQAEMSGAIFRISDVTESKKIQEQLIRADRLSSLGQLSGGIAHEIRNPLGGINLFTDILCDEEKFERTDQEKEILHEIKDNINRIDGIIKRVLDFARPPAESSDRVEINALIRENIKFWSARLRKSKIELELSLDDELPHVQGDAIGLQQVINNLTLNAIEAMDNGGFLGITTSSGVSAFHKNRRVVIIKVKDNGCGIKQEQMKTVFNPFFTTKATGTGLGLAIVHQTIERNGGAVSVESEPGKGTTFAIELPVSVEG